MIGHDPSIEVGENYRRFAAMEARGKSPLYDELATAIAADPEVLNRLCELPPAKRQPNLFLGAVRVLYGTANGYAQFRKLALDNWEQVSATMRERRTQTNEVGRCAVLLPILAALEAPIHLLEVGTSAGLLLLLDRYGYDFDGVRLNAGSPVTLPCHLQGFEPPSELPAIGWRLGVDIAPLDIGDDADCRWLEALVWPGMDERAERLSAALSLARRSRPPVEHADLRQGLRRFIDQAPHDGTRVVLHSAVLAYVDANDRERFIGEIEDAGVTRLGCEGDTTGRGFTISLDGNAVAKADGHGAWLERLA